MQPGTFIQTDIVGPFIHSLTLYNVALFERVLTRHHTKISEILKSVYHSKSKNALRRITNIVLSIRKN